MNHTLKCENRIDKFGRHYIVAEGEIDYSKTEPDLSTPNALIAKAVVLRTARLQSVANWLASEIQVELDGLRRKLAKLTVTANPTGATTRAQRQARMTKLFAAAEVAVTETFDELVADTQARFDQLGLILTDGVMARMKTHHGVEGGAQADASQVLILGATLVEHFEKMATDLLFRFKTAVRQGAELDEDASDTVSRLDSGAPQSPEPNEPVKAAEPLTDAAAAAVDKRLSVGVRIFDSTTNSIQKVIEAGVNALASEVDFTAGGGGDQTGKSMGWQWVAVMDGNTCEACEFYDGHQWDADFEPIDDAPEYPGDPGLHFNCRCSRVPVDLDSDPIPEGVGFDDYLSQFSDSELKEAFGPAALSAYRRGEMTAAQLAGQKENLMTLEAFKAAEAV